MFDITTTGKLALFVALPTTFVLLYLLLRHTDDNEEEDSKSSKSKSSMTVTEVKIPSYATSAIIGTNRSSLQRLQNSCNVQIDLKQDGDTSSTEDQTLCIRGSLEATQQIELRIQQIISDISTVASEDMYIPSSSTISLIGNNYQTVRYINRVSGAKVLIDTTENRDPKHMQLVSIEGSREQIEHAKKLINDVVDKNLTFHEEPLSQCSSSDTAAHLMHRVAHTKNAAARDSGEHTVPLSHLTKDAPTDLLELMVVSVTSPGHFWAHIRNENLPKLVNLQKNIDEFYSDSKHFQTYQCQEVAVDDIVAVCLSNQSQWYRARVTAVLSNSYKVFCVDYGYNEEVPKDNVCRLREDYLSLPYQAVECYLANIKPKDDPDWTRSACNAFENMVCMNQSKIISGEIVRYQPTSHGLVPCLQLIDYDGPQVTWCNLWLRAYTKRAAAKTTNINEELVKMGHAEWNKSSSRRDTVGKDERCTISQEVLNSEGFGSTESLTDPFLKSPPTEETPISLPPANTGWADDFPWAWAYNEEESAPGKDVCEMQTRLSNIHSPTVEIRQPGAGDITSLQETNALTKKTSETSDLAEHSEDKDGNTASKAEEVSNGFFYNGICSDVDAGLVKATSDLNVDHVTNNDSLVESPSANENSKLKYLDRREEISPSSDYDTSEMFDSGLMSGDLSISTPISETSHEFDHESLDQSDLEYVAHSQSDVTRVEKPESGSGGALDLGVTQVSEDNYSTDICESSITVSRDDVSSGLDSLQGDQIRFSQEMSSLVIKDGSLLDQATLQATNTKESDPLSFQESSVSPILKQPLKIQSLDGEETEDYELEHTGEKLNSLGAKDVVSRRDTNVQKYEELKSSEKLIPVEADTNISLLDSDRTQKTTQEIVTSGEAAEASLQSTGKPEETKTSDTVDAQFSRSDLVTNVSSHTETSRDESELNNFEYISVDQKTDMKMTDTTSSILVNQSDNIPQWTNLEDKTYQVSSNLDDTQTLQPHQYITEILYDICPVTKMTSISKDIMTSKAGLTQPETKTSSEPENNRLPSHSEEVTLNVSTGFDGRSSPIDQTVQPHSDSVTSNLDTEYNEVWTKFYSPLEEDNDWNEKPCLTLKEPSKDNNDTMTYLLKDDSTQSEPLENEIEQEDIWKMFYNPISNKDWEEKALKITRDNEIWRKFYETDENTDDYKSLIDRNQYSTDWKYTVSEPLEEDRKDHYIWSRFYSSEDSFKGVGDTKTSERRKDPQVTKVESDSQIGDKITSGVVECSSQGTQELLGIHHSEVNNITTQVLMDGDDSQDPESSGKTVHSVDREINTNKSHEIFKNENVLDPSKNGNKDAVTDEKNLEYSALEEDNDCEEKDPSKLQVVEYHQLPVQTFLESWKDTASDPLEDADILTRNAEIPNYDTIDDGKNINTVIYSNIPDISTPTSENVIREVGVSKVMSVQIDNLEYSALEEDNDWDEKGPTLFQVKHPDEKPVETFLESWTDTVSDPLEDADILSTEDHTPDDGKTKDQNVSTKSIDVKKLESISTSENIVHESVGDDVTSVRIEPSDYNLEYSALEEDNDWKEKDPTLVQVRTKVEEPAKTFLESWKDTVSDPLEDADILSTEDQTPDDIKPKDQNIDTKGIDVKKLESISTSENIVHESVGDDVTSVTIEPSDDNLEYSALEEDNDWKEKDPTLVQLRTKVEEPAKTFLESWKDTVSDPLEDADILSTEDQIPDDVKRKDQNIDTKGIDVKKLESISTSENIVHESVGDDVTSVTIEPSDDNLEYSALEEDNDWKEKDPTLVQVRTKVEEPAKTFLESWKDTVSDPLEDADILSTEDQTPDDIKPKDQNIDTKGIDVKKLESISTSENIVHESVGDDVTSVTIEPSDYNLEYSALEEDNDWKEKDPTLVQVRTKVEEPAKTFLESWKDTVSDPLEDADILSTEDQIPDDVKRKDQNIDTKGIDVKKLESISTSENIVHESVGDDVTSVTIEPSDDNLEYSALEEDNDWKEKDPTLVQVRTKVEEPAKTFLESWKDTVSDPLEDADILSTEDQTPDDIKPKDQNIDTKGIDVKKLESISTSENIVHESVGVDVTSVTIEPSDDNLEYSALEEDNDWKEKDPTLVQVRTKVEEPAKTFLESWKDTVSDPLEDADILSTEDQTPYDVKPKDQNIDTKGIDVKKLESISTSENIVHKSVGEDVTSVTIEPSDYNLEYSALEEDNDWKEKDPTLVQVRTKVEEPAKTFLESWKDTVSDPLEDADILSSEDQISGDVKPKDQDADLPSASHHKDVTDSSEEKTTHEETDVWSMFYTPMTPREDDNNLKYSVLEEDNDWEEKDATLVQVTSEVEEPIQTFLESWKDTASDPLEDADILSTEDQIPDDGKPKDQGLDTKNIATNKLECISTSESIVRESVGDDVTSVRIEPSDYNLEYSALEEDNDWKEKDPTLVQVRTKVEEPVQTFLESWKDTASDPLEDADILSTEEQIPDDVKTKQQNIDTKGIDVKKLESIFMSENIVHESVGDDVTSVRIEPSDDNLEYSALEEDNDWKEKDPTLVQVRPKVEEPAKTFLESWKDTVSDPLEDADILSTDDSDNFMQSRHAEVVAKSSTFPIKRNWDSDDNIYVSVDDIENELGITEVTRKLPSISHHKIVTESSDILLGSSNSGGKHQAPSRDIEENRKESNSEKGEISDDKTSAENNISGRHFDLSLLSDSMLQDKTLISQNISFTDEYSIDRRESFLIPDTNFRTIERSSKSISEDFMKPHGFFQSDTTSESKSIDHIDDSPSKPEGSLIKDTDIKKMTCDTIQLDEEPSGKADEIKTLEEESDEKGDDYDDQDDDDIWLTMLSTSPENGEMEEYDKNEEVMSDNDDSSTDKETSSHYEYQDSNAIDTQTSVFEKTSVHQTTEDGKLFSEKEIVEREHQDLCHKQTTEDSEYSDKEDAEFVDAEEELKMEFVDAEDGSETEENTSYTKVDYSALEEDNGLKEKDPTLAQERPEDEEPAETSLQSCEDIVSGHLKDVDILRTEDHQISGDLNTKGQDFETKAFGRLTSENVGRERFDDHDVTSVKIEPSDDNLEYSALEEDNDWEEKDPTLVQVRTKVEEPVQTFLESWKDTASDPLEDADILSTEEQIPDDVKTKQQNIDTKGIDVKKLESIFMSENIVHESVGDDVTTFRIEPSDDNLEYSALEEDNDWKEKDPTLVQVRPKVEEPAKTFLESWKDTVSDPLEDADILSIDDSDNNVIHSRHTEVVAKSSTVSCTKQWDSDDNIYVSVNDIEKELGIPDKTRDLPSASHYKDVTDSSEEKATHDETDVWSMFYTPMTPREDDNNLEYSALEEDNDWEEKDATLVQVTSEVEEPIQTFLESWKDTASDPLEDADILSTEDQIPDDGKPKDQGLDTKNITTKKLECISTSESIVRESVGDDVTSLRIEPSDYNLEYSALEEDNDWKEKDPTLVQVRTKVEEPAKTFLESWKDTVSDPLEDADILSTEDQTPDDVKPKDQNVDTKVIATKKLECLSTSESIVRESVGDDVTSVRIEPSDYNLEYSALEEDNDWKEKSLTSVQVKHPVEEPVQTFMESWKDTVSDPLEDADILSTEDSDNVIQSRHTEVVPKSSAVPCKEEWDAGDDIYVSVDDIENELSITERTKDLHSASHQKNVTDSSEEKTAKTSDDETDVWSMFYTPITPGGDDDNLEYSALEEDNDKEEKDLTLVQVRTKVEEPVQTFLESGKDTASDPLEDADILSTEDQIPDDGKPKDQGLDTKNIATNKLECISTSENIVHESVGDDVTSVRIEPSDDNLEYSALEEDNDWKEKDPTLVQVRPKVEEPAKTFLESWKDTVSDPLEDADILSTEDHTPDDGKTKDQNVDTKVIATKKLECLSTSESIVRESVGDDVTSVRIEPSDYNLEYSALEEDNDWQEKSFTSMQVKHPVEEPVQTFMESWKDTVSDPLEDADILSTEDSDNVIQSRHTEVVPKSSAVPCKEEWDAGDDIYVSVDDIENELFITERTKDLHSASHQKNVTDSSEEKTAKTSDDETDVWSMFYTPITPGGDDDTLEYSALEEDNDKEEKDLTLVQVRTKVEEPVQTFLESGKDAVSDPLEDADILRTDDSDNVIQSRDIEVIPMSSTVPCNDKCDIGDDIYVSVDDIENELGIIEGTMDLPSASHHNEATDSSEAKTTSDENDVWSMFYTPVTPGEEDDNLEYSALEADNDWEEKDPTLVQVRTKVEEPAKTFLESWQDNVSDPLEDADILSTEEQIFDDIKPKDQNVDTKNIATKKVECISTSENIVQVSVGDDVTTFRIEPSDDNLQYSALEEDNDWEEKDPTLVQVRTKVEEPAKTFLESWQDTVSDPLEDADILSTEDQISGDVETKEFSTSGGKEHRMKHLALEEVSDCEDNVPMDSSVEHHEILEYDSISDSENEENYSPPLQFSADNDCHLTQLNHGFAGKKSLVTKAVNTDDNEVWNMYFTSHQKDSEYAEIEKYPLEDVESVKLRLNSRMDDFSKGSLHSEPSSRETSTSPLSFEQLKETASDIDYSIDHREDFNWELREQIASNLSLQDKSYCYRDQPEFFSGSLDSWASSTGTMFTATPGYLSSTCLSDNENTPLMSNSDDEYLDAKDIFFEDEPHVKVDIPYTHDTQSEVNESITLFLPTDEETTKTLNKAEQEKAEALQRKHIIEEEISLLLSEIVAMASEGTKRTEKANLSEQDVKAEGTKISQKITEIIQGMVHSNENMEGKVAKDINAIIPQDANLTEVQDTMRSTEVMDNQETYSDELVVPSETETKYVNLEVTEQMEQKLQNVASLYSNYAEDIPDTQLMLKLETLYFIEKMGKNKDKDNLDTQGNLQSSKFVTSIESTCDKNIKHQDNQHVDNFKSSEFSELSTDQHQETDQSTEVQSKSSANENEEIFANVLMVELPITEELHVSDEHLDSSESSINRTKDSENCRFTSTLELQLPNTGVSDTTKLQNQRSSAKKDGLTSRSKRSKSKLSPGDRIARRWRKKSPHRNYSNALFINVPNYSESSEEEMSKDVEESQLDNEECKMALKHHRLSESGFPIETHSELLKRLSSMESDCSSTSSYEGFRCTLHTFVPDYDMKNYHNIFVIPKRYGTFSTEVNMNIAEPKETNLLDESSPSKKTVKSSVTLANSPEEVLCTIAKSPSEHTTTSDNFESKRKESVEEETTIIVKNTDEEKLSDKSNDRRDSVVIDFTADERRNDRMSYFTEEQIQDMLQKVNQKGSVTQYSKSGYQTDCYSFIKENEFRYGTSNYPSLMNYPSQAEPYWQTKSSDPEKTMLLTYSEMLLSSDIISSKAENAHEIADNDSNIINDDTEKPTDVLDSTDMEKLRRESQELTQTSEQLAIDLSSLLSVDSSEISDELSQNYVTKRPKSPEDHSESSQETSSSDSDGDYPSNQHLILEFGGEIDVSNKCTKLPSANISSDETNLQTQSDDVSMKSEDVISETDKTALTEANLSEEIIATVPDSADGKPVHVDNFPEHSEYLSSQATEEISEENSIIEIVEDHTEGPNDKMFDDVSEFVDRKEVFFGTMRQQIDKPLLSYSLPVNTSLAESSSSLHDGADCETSKETVSSDVDIFQMKLLNRELCETNELNAIQHEELNEPQAKELDNVSVLESVGKEFEFTSASSFEESSVSIPENSLAEKSVPVKDHSEEEIMPVTFDEVKSNFTEETSTKKPEDISNAEFSETDIGKFSPGSNEVELELQKPPENILQLSEQFYKECFGNESSYVMTEFPEELRSREEYSVILTDKHLATFDENQRQETDICRNYSTEKDQFLKETDADAKSTGIKSKKKKKQKKKPRFFALDNEMLMQFVETTAELSKESEFDSSGVDQNDSAVTKSQMEIQSLAELETEESLKELPPTSLAAEDKFEISEDTLKTESKINSVTEEPRLSHDADFVDAITEQESSTELLDPEFTPNVIKENAKIEEIEQTVNKLVVSPCKEMFTHETEISSIECKVSEITSEPLNDNTINIKYSDEVGFDLASVQQPEAFVNVADTEPYCQLLKEQTDIGVIEHSSVDQLEKKEEQSKNVDLVKHVEISDVQETFTESSNVNLTAEWDNATQLEIEHRSCLLKTEESPDQLEIKESTCLLKTTEDTALSKTEESTTQTEIKDSSPAQMESEIFSKSSPEKIELKTDITEVEQKQLEVKCGESTVTASPTFPVQSTVTAGDVSINAPEEEKPKKKRKKRRSPYLYGYGDDSVNSSDFIEPVISDPDVSQHILPALAETVSSCTDTTALKSTESKSSPETITDKDIDATPNENQVKEATPEIKDPVSTREPMDVTCTKCSPEEETDKDIHPKKKKKKKKKSSLKDENEATSEQKKSNQSSKKDKESFSKEKTPDTLCKDGALDQKYKSLAANSSNIKSQEGDDQIPLVKELKDSEATKSQDDYPKTDRQLSSEEELQKEFVVESNEERTDECVYSLLPSETEIDVTTHQASMLEDVKGEMIVENIHKTAQKENKPCSLVQAKVEQLSRSEEGNNLAFAQEKTHSSAIVKEDLDESYLELELSRKSVLDKQVSKSISSPPEGTGSDKHLLFSEDFKDADFRLAEKSDKKSFVSISESNENVQSEIFDETNIVDKDNESSGTSNTKIASLESKKKRRSPFPYGDDEKSILSKGIEEFFQSTHSKATETGPLYVDTPAMTSELNVAKTPDLTISNQSFSISEELKHSQVMTIPGDTKKKKKQKKTSQVKFCESGKVIPVPPESSSVETSAKISVVEDKNTVEIKKDVSKTENKVSQTLSKVSSAISKKAQSVLEDSPIRKKKSSTSNEESSEDSKTNENNSSILKLSKKKTKHKEVSAKENSSELCPSKESKNLSTDSSSITSSEHSQKKFIAETEKLVKLEPVEEKTTLMSIAPPISKIPSETDSKCPNKENKEKEESSTGKVAKSVVDKISSLVTSITKQVTDSLEELSTHKKKKLKQSSLTIPELKETEDKRSFKERTESSNSESKNKSNKKVLDSSLSEKSMRKVGEANPNSKQKSQKGNSSSKASPLLSKKKQKSKHSRDSKNIPVSLIKIESPYRQHTYLPLIQHLTEEEAAFSDTTPLTKRKKRQRKKKKHHNMSQLSTTTESSCEIDTALWLHSNKSSRDNSSHQRTKIPPRPKIVVSEDTSAPPLPLPRANSTTPPTKRAGTPTSPYLSADSFNNPRSRSRCRRSPVKELLWLSEQEMLSDRNDSDSTRRGRSLNNINRISKINLAYISTGTRVRKRRKKNIIAVS